MFQICFGFVLFDNNAGIQYIGLFGRISSQCIFAPILFFVSNKFIFILFSFQYMSSSLSSAAHNITSNLYTFLFRNRVSIVYKLKICAFIEKLDGPIIGYYCYDLFAFTNYELYQYIAFFSSNYILMNDLLFVERFVRFLSLHLK